MKLRRKLRLFVFLVVVLSVLGGAAYILRPVLVQMGMTALIREAGFTQARIGDTTRIPGGYRFADIKLDRNGFSTIETMVLQSGTLTVEKLVLTGEWKDLKKPDIAGLTHMPRPDRVAGRLHGRGIRVVALNGGQLDVTLPHLGLIRAEAKGQATLLPDGAMRLQAALWSMQQKLQTQMTLNGEFADSGIAALDIEITEGKIDTAQFSASRIGGWLILNRDRAATPWAVSSQLMAGMASLGKTTVSSLTLSAQGTTDSVAIALQASSTASDKITPLSVDLNLNRNGEDNIAATFRAESLGVDRPGAVFVYDARGKTLDAILRDGNIAVADLAGNIWMKGALRRVDDKAEIDVHEMRLQPLADSFGLLDVTVDGVVTGLLPIIRDGDGRLVIDQGLLRSTVPGRLSFTGKALPGRLESTRDDAGKLLRAFLYDRIEMLVNGHPFNGITGDLSISGKTATEKDSRATMVTLRF